jgi:hypothetical protein
MRSRSGGGVQCHFRHERPEEVRTAPSLGISSGKAPGVGLDHHGGRSMSEAIDQRNINQRR